MHIIYTTILVNMEQAFSTDMCQEPVLCMSQSFPDSLCPKRCANKAGRKPHHHCQSCRGGWAWICIETFGWAKQLAFNTTSW